ncbi:hypothetical protein ACN38_g3823, partial [Penicillium nordicum]
MLCANVTAKFVFLDPAFIATGMAQTTSLRLCLSATTWRRLRATRHITLLLVYIARQQFRSTLTSQVPLLNL